MDYHPPPDSLPSMKITKFLEDPAEREWKEPFTFIVGADTQFGMSMYTHCTKMLYVDICTYILQSKDSPL